MNALLSLMREHPGRTLLMGILNLTPDSFSDGGLFYEDTRHALEHALRMVEEGADIIDVGGESTRPGAAPVPPAEQLRRVSGVLAELRRRLPERIVLSIDTTSAEVAAGAVAAGAALLNDVSAGRNDPAMLELAARRGLPIVLMHMQGTPRTMQEQPVYQDVIREVRDFLLERAAQARRVGLAPGQLILDPGIGFGKTREHNLELLAHLEALTGTGYPILLGTSRKRFMRELQGAREARYRIGATCATTVLGVQAGVRIFRVHDVRPNRQAADLTGTLEGCR